MAASGRRRATALEHPPQGFSSAYIPTAVRGNSSHSEFQTRVPIGEELWLHILSSKCPHLSPCHLLYCLHSPRHFCETVLYLPGLFSTNIFLGHKDHSVCSLHTTACPGQCVRAALGKHANETVQGRTASDGWGLLAAEL